MGERVIMKVKALAPDFTVTDVFDREIKLRNYRGKRVLVAFFRHAGCPFCNMRVHKLQTKHEEFKALGLEMIFFFESEAKTLLGNEFHKGISPIPLVSDPDKITYDLYGVEESAMKSAKSHLTSFFSNAIRAKLNRLPVHWMEGSESINTIPAEFLIDEYGVVQKVLYAKSLTERMSLDVIKNFAEVGKLPNF